MKEEISMYTDWIESTCIRLCIHVPLQPMYTWWICRIKFCVTTLLNLTRSMCKRIIKLNELQRDLLIQLRLISLFHTRLYYHKIHECSAKINCVENNVAELYKMNILFFDSHLHYLHNGIYMKYEKKIIVSYNYNLYKL